MHQHSTTKVSIFSQLSSLLPRDPFNGLVTKYEANKASKGNNSWNHLISMIFCQFSGCIGLRDIEKGLGSYCSNIEHLGMSKPIPRSSLSYLNENRDWRLFRDYYFKMLDRFAASLERSKRSVGLRIKRKIFVADSTVIPLCMEVFDWARYKQQKGAIKMHTVLDFDMDLPVFADVTEGKKHDIHLADMLDLPRGSVLVGDRAYMDFSWLGDLDSKGVNFVVRIKENLRQEIVKDHDVTEERAENLLSDEDIRLLGQHTSQAWAKSLRVVRFLDYEGREVAVVTNNNQWVASTVQELYKNRWSIETFFRELKQNFRIKSFVGTSYNGVLIQIWTALIAMLLLKYLKIKSAHGWHLSNLAQQIKIHLFTKMYLWSWLEEPIYEKPTEPPGEQVQLF